MRSVTLTQALRPLTCTALFASGAALLTAVACGNHKPAEKATTATCINSCVPDLGSRPMTQKDCDDAEAGLEFLPLPIWDMGHTVDSDNEISKRTIASGMYFYDDKTARFRVPGKIWEPATEVAFSGVPPYPIDGEVRAGWIPPDKYDELTKYWAHRPPLREAVGRCGEPLPYPNDPAATNAEAPVNVHYALHVAGGPFVEWGGGMGKMLKCMNTDATNNSMATGSTWSPDVDVNKYLCSNRKSGTFHHRQANGKAIALAACNNPDDGETPTADGKTTLRALMQEVCPARDKLYRETGEVDESDEPHMIGMALDMSKWEGISFWARRSPNSQDGIRIAVADKYVDDDMSYLSMKRDRDLKLAGKSNQERPRYCERKVVCGCQNNKPCTPILVTDNVFDRDGNRVKWNALDGDQRRKGRIAVDGPPMYDASTPEALHEIRHNRRSLINLSGEAKPNPNMGGAKTFDDGEAIMVFNGFGGGGQPYDSDVLVQREETFCFDPAVDPTPPAGTPVGQIINRSYQYQRVIPANGPSYGQLGPLGFFTNTNNPASFDPTSDDQGSHTPDEYQLWPPDPSISEVPGYNYMPCGDSFCEWEYSGLQGPDPQAWGRKCTPFPFKGGITYSYCFNPGEDPNPPEGSQQCGDFWLKPVALTTDWAFYKVPFSSLIQQGWAKRFYEFDLTSLTDVRIQWDRGWIDFWISDVRFYRTKKQ